MTAADTIAQTLARLSSDRRTTANQYLNITARPGNGLSPRRLMSDIGFLQEANFSYGTVHPANATYNDTDNPRELKQIVLVGYGLRSDYRRLVSSRPEDRNIQTPGSTTSSGLATYPGNEQVLMSSALNAGTYAQSKTRNVLQAMAALAGPAVHFLVDRLGNVVIGASVDAEVTAVPTYQENGVIIALETACVIGRADHAIRRYDRIVELPFTTLQLVSLAVLVKKLLTALGSAFPKTFTSSLSNTDQGFTYVLADSIEGFSPFNFQADPRSSVIPNVTFDYSGTSNATFFNTVEAQPAFDLATDVWRTTQAPRAVAGRTAIATAIGEVDTAGAESVYLGAYATLAAEERSTEMQTTQRQQMFVQRQRVSHRNADDAANEAATVSETGSSATTPNTPATNTAPHTYDFSTGRWGDNETF